MSFLLPSVASPAIRSNTRVSAIAVRMPPRSNLMVLPERLLAPPSVDPLMRLSMPLPLRLRFCDLYLIAYRRPLTTSLLCHLARACVQARAACYHRKEALTPRSNSDPFTNPVVLRAVRPVAPLPLAFRTRRLARVLLGIRPAFELAKAVPLVELADRLHASPCRRPSSSLVQAPARLKVGSVDGDVRRISLYAVRLALLLMEHPETFLIGIPSGNVVASVLHTPRWRHRAAVDVALVRIECEALVFEVAAGTIRLARSAVAYASRVVSISRMQERALPVLARFCMP